MDQYREGGYIDPKEVDRSIPRRQTDRCQGYGHVDIEEADKIDAEEAYGSTPRRRTC